MLQIEYTLEANQTPIKGVPGPIPALRIQAYSRGRVIGESPPTPTPGGGRLFVMDIIPTITLNGIYVSDVRFESGPHFGDEASMIFHQEVKCIVPLPRYLLEAIESTRQVDLPISVSVQLRYLAPNDPPGMPLRSAHGNLNLKISQRDWLAALAEMGFTSGWVLEIPRPEIEGWGATVGLLERAHERFDARDPEGAISQCRSAWKQLEPLLKGVWGDVAAEIDRGSRAEDNFPEKSKRIASMQTAATAWANTGPHTEYYAASMEDALLAIQVTYSLVAYLSRKATQAQSRGAK
jgi:hypothetical protein